MAVAAAAAEPDLQIFSYLFAVIRLATVTEKPAENAIRSIPLPAAPLGLALSCDCSMLAVNVAISNSYIIIVYQVQTFLSAVSSQ